MDKKRQVILFLFVWVSVSLFAQNNRVIVSGVIERTASKDILPEERENVIRGGLVTVTAFPIDYEIYTHFMPDSLYQDKYLFIFPERGFPTFAGVSEESESRSRDAMNKLINTFNSIPYEKIKDAGYVRKRLKVVLSFDRIDFGSSFDDQRLFFIGSYGGDKKVEDVYYITDVISWESAGKPLEELAFDYFFHNTETVNGVGAPHTAFYNYLSINWLQNVPWKSIAGSTT